MLQKTSANIYTLGIVLPKVVLLEIAAVWPCRKMIMASQLSEQFSAVGGLWSIKRKRKWGSSLCWTLVNPSYPSIISLDHIILVCEYLSSLPLAEHTVRPAQLFVSLSFSHPSAADLKRRYKPPILADLMDWECSNTSLARCFLQSALPFTGLFFSFWCFAMMYLCQKLQSLMGPNGIFSLAPNFRV